MNKATEIKTTQDVVKDVLESDMMARNSDDYLIYAVCKRINPMCLGMPFESVIRHRKDLGLPVFETIRRTGQRMREKHPELAGNGRVEAERKKNEAVFKEYARGLYEE